MNTQRRFFAPGSWLARLAAGGALVALVAGSVAAPVSAQPVPSDVRTILVTGTGAATAPAETARIQFSIAAYADYSMAPVMPVEEAEISAEAVEAAGTPEVVMSEPAVSTSAMPAIELTEDDLAPVVDALVAAGAPAEAIVLHTGPSIGGYYGPGAPGYALLEIVVPAPTLEQVTAIIEAGNHAASGMLAVQQVGVEYNVADCGPLLDAARQAAFTDARTRAESLAQHIGASVGAPLQVSDFGSTQAPIGGGTGCPPTPDMAMSLYAPAPIFNAPPFNPLAPAEARVLVQFSVTYEIELASQ